MRRRAKILYAKEVMELMGPYPGRQFRMGDIVRSIIGAKPDRRRRNATREAVRIVLKELNKAGTVTIEEAGTIHLYTWRKCG